MDKEKCEHCSGKPLIDRKPLMINSTGNYTVFINSCNYLEDSVTGNSVHYSLRGIKINFCPACGRELGKYS